MSDTELLIDALMKGLISFERTPTDAIATDSAWWRMRAWVLGTDRDRQAAELPIDVAMWLRRN